MQHNYELEKEILGFGDGMIVLAPERLRVAIRQRLQAGLDAYAATESHSSKPESLFP